MCTGPYIYNNVTLEYMDWAPSLLPYIDCRVIRAMLRVIVDDIENITFSVDELGMNILFAFRTICFLYRDVYRF